MSTPSTQLKLCERHQQEPNRSRFDPSNCDYCRLEEAAKAFKCTVAAWVDVMEAAGCTDKQCWKGEIKDALKRAGKAGI